jgi:hypothetical protein
MNWQPTIRETLWNDFENRLAIEGSDIDVKFPVEFTDGTHLGWAELMDEFWALEDSGGNPPLQERYLRAAALRGDPFAMMILAEICAGREHDDEAWRWLKRAQKTARESLEDNHASGNQDSLQKIIFDAEEWLRVVVHNGANTQQVEPMDLGRNSAANLGLAPQYCLSCGGIKDNAIPVGGCEGQVHLRVGPNGIFLPI